VGDTALVWCDLNVSLGSPGGTPGVLNEEVVLARLGSVADSEHTVVEFGSATVGNDTVSVSLESHLIGLDGNRDWSLGKGSLKLLARCVLSHILESLDFTASLRFLVLAVSLLGGVWVGGLLHEWVSLDVFESVVHKTTIATAVLLGAVNKLLLRVGLKGSGGEEHGSLNGTSGGEGPA